MYVYNNIVKLHFHTYKNIPPFLAASLVIMHLFHCCFNMQKL